MSKQNQILTEITDVIRKIWLWVLTGLSIAVAISQIDIAATDYLIKLILK